MHRLSRTEHVARNALYGVLAQVVSTILHFISRTVFIYILGKEYLGVNGLFTNILLILSFAELGIGNAMIYSMYKPLKDNDEDTLRSLIDLYKKSYRYIGIFIITIGLLVIPFLKYLIHGTAPNIKENITIIYVFFLANTVVSYFFVYKQSLIIADQNNHITIAYTQFFEFIQILLQIVALVFFKSFILFLTIQFVCILLINIVLARKADKMYPFIKTKEIKQLSTTKKRGIFKNIKALAVYKFASVILNGTNNIILSLLFNIGVVGVYSNYMLFIQFFTTFLGRITNAFTASIGNLNTEHNPYKQCIVFKQLFLICVWLFGLASIELFLLHENIITIWIGRDYVFNNNIVLAIVVHFYINAVSFAAYTYRTTLGLFVQGQIAPAIAAILNIILSLALGMWIGIAGIFWATAISRFVTMGIVDPILVYKKALKLNPIYYYLMYFKYVIYLLGIYIVCKHVLSLINQNGIFGIIIKIAVILVIYNTIMYLLTFHTTEFQRLKSSFSLILNNKKNVTKL